jgi:hypothetical protein
MRSLVAVMIAASAVALATIGWAQQDTGQAGTSGTGHVDPTPQPAPAWHANPPVTNDADRQRREEILDRVNRPGPPLPEGPAGTSGQERVAPPPVPPTAPQGPPADRDSSRLDPPGQLFVYRNTSMGAAAPDGFKSVINEPTADGYGNVVVQTGNWYIGVSQDGGASFSFLDPASFMTGVDNGFCCDQVVSYDQSRDLLLGLLMSTPSAGTQRNTVRLWAVRGLRSGINYAVYSYDFVAQIVGYPPDRWLDFPKLVMGRNHAYLTANVYTPAGCVPNNTTCSFVGSVIVRLPLDPIRDAAGFTFNFFQSPLGTPAVAEGIANVAYWASHLSLSSIRIHRWSDDSGTIFMFDRAVPAWSDATRACPGPDGRDWCGRADGRILGAYVRDRVDDVDGKEVGFMWSSAPHAGRPMPYVRAVRFAVSGLTLIDVPDIWNPSSAFIYPYAAPNAVGGLGLSLFFGGGPLFPVHVVCISDDLSAVPPSWDCTGTVASTQGPNANRWGDYLSVRTNWPRANTWRATGFALIGGGDGNQIDPRYIEFGRGRDLP